LQHSDKKLSRKELEERARNERDRKRKLRQKKEKEVVSKAEKNDKISGVTHLTFAQPQQDEKDKKKKKKKSATQPAQSKSDSATGAKEVQKTVAKTLEEAAGAITVEDVRKAIHNAEKNFPNAQELQVRDLAGWLELQLPFSWKHSYKSDEPAAFLESKSKSEIITWLKGLKTEKLAQAFVWLARTLYNESGDEKKSNSLAGVKIMLQLVAKSAPEVISGTASGVFNGFNKAGTPLQNFIWILKQIGDSTNPTHRFKAVAATLLPTYLKGNLKPKDEKSLFETIDAGLTSLAKTQSVQSLIEPDVFVTLQKQHLDGSSNKERDQQIKTIYEQAVKHGIKAAPAEFFPKLLQALKGANDKEREHVLAQLEKALKDDTHKSCAQWNKTFGSAVAGSTQLLQRLNESDALHSLKAKDINTLRDTVARFGEIIGKQDKKDDKIYQNCLTQVNTFLSKFKKNQGGGAGSSVLRNGVAIGLLAGLLFVSTVKFGCVDSTNIDPYLNDSTRATLGNFCSRLPANLIELFR
jgi:hypothetical protein